MTNLITLNPYRILGVYSNSPMKDILSNLNKTKAFLKVGKVVSFPLDLPQLLPSIERDEAIVSSAQTSIELPMDQIKHTLFWFMKETPLDDIALNHLMSGNIVKAKEIWGKKETVSSLLNLMTCAMIEGDIDSLVVNADTLFQKYSSEFCSYVNETIKLSSTQLTELFVEQLKIDGNFDLSKMMQVSGTSNEWREIIGASLVKPIINQITIAITEAKSAKGPIANLRSGEKLINATKGLLLQLKSFLGVSDMQYQMIADKLATTILQCGINYFNDAEEDDAVEKSMKLQNYALSIAVGQMAKDRCLENINILKKIGPEYKAQKEINSIGEKLKHFAEKKYLDTAIINTSQDGRICLNRINIYGCIGGFVDNCKQDLLSLRHKLGSSNSLYLKISSAVASAAINEVVKTFNNDQEIAKITNSIDGLWYKVDSALSTMSKISSLDMTTECRSYFNNNNSTLKSIHSQLINTPQRIQSNKSGGCYIATMAYGDYDHPQVMVLRQFRDVYLDKRNWGKKFIKFYYANSPHWVKVLKNHKFTNTLIRKFLDSFIYFWKKTSYYE